MRVFISKEYQTIDSLKKYQYIKSSFDDELLGQLWRSYDFDKAEEALHQKQCQLTKATFRKDKKKIDELQDTIVHMHEARMLAVRKVAEISKSSAGVDGIVWRKDSDKMRAAILLNSGTYKSQPLKFFVFKDKKCNKERTVGMPTVTDRAMQILFAFALDPISEATADRKSFAFRKGRSSQLAHSFVMKALKDETAAEWILISDISSYYDTISHKWLLENIPMNKYVLKQFIKCGYVLNGKLFEKDEGISLGCNISTILGNMVLDGLQKELYSFQGEKIRDYYNGYCIRFADDIIITARTKRDAEHFYDILLKFTKERGLKLSEKKTKIVNINNGFNFLSRFYLKTEDEIKCIPSQKAVNKFENEIKELIFDENINYSQSKLIRCINSKITRICFIS